jgi:hypothetical protein
MDVVSGFIPIVTPEVFGKPYLVCIHLDPKEYQVSEDLDVTINGLLEFFQEGVGHAPIAFYVFVDKESGVWQVYCVTMVKRIESLLDNLYYKQNIAREFITTTSLERIDGIPNYSEHSLHQESKTKTGEEG